MLDTNVWISALLWGGKPAEIVRAAEQNKFTVFASEQVIGEISQVLTYPKIRDVYQAEGLGIEDLIESILKIVNFVEAIEDIQVVVEHPADNKFIECAKAAKADYIVCGDRRLLNVGCYQKTKIITVNDFLKVLENKKDSKRGKAKA